MTKDHWLLGAVILMIFLVASPFYTMYRFSHGIFTKNPRALASAVDFDELRKSTKDQFLAMILRKQASENLSDEERSSNMELLNGDMDNEINKWISYLITPTGMLAIQPKYQTNEDLTKLVSDFRGFVQHCRLESLLEIDCHMPLASGTLVFSTNNLLTWYLTEFRLDQVT